MSHLLDADVFIRAKRDHYRFKVCPGFWDWIQKASAAGSVFSIQQVRDELTRGNDDLAAWASRSASLFLSPDATVTKSLARVSAWVASQAYQPQAVAEFLSAADYWLVAHALAKGWTVVTHEVAAPGSKKKVKLPDVCAGVGVTCTNPFQMLDSAGASFVISA